MVISEANGSTENGQERAIEYSDLPAVTPTHRCCVAHAINETDDEWKPRRIDDRSHHGSTISIGSLGRGTTRVDEVRHFVPVASSYRFGAVPIHLAALLFLCLPDAPSDTVSGW